MIAEWPAELPRPLRQGYGQAAGEARRRTRVDHGPVRVSRRFSLVADSVSLTIDVSRADRARFDRFYVEDIRHGTLPFLMPDPTTDGWALLDENELPILDETGQPVLMAETWLCMMGDSPPRAEPYGTRFLVAFDVAVMP